MISGMMRMNHQVTRYAKGDEMHINRLFSFLFQKGGIHCKKISQIKPNVFYLLALNDLEFIVKKHRRRKIVEQQWDFFEKINTKNIVAFERFPNGKQMIAAYDEYWTLAPYIRGKKLDYRKEEDREAGLMALQRFSLLARNIYVPKPIQRQYFYVRWYKRLQSFKQTEHYFLESGHQALFRDIVKTTIKTLSYVAQLPWKEIEQRAAKNGEWIHGDVAGHNFIQTDNKIYLIDFDLLSQQAQIHDYIQLGQRFLPYVNWNLDKLLTYRMVPEQELNMWLSALSVPSDVLREWLFFLHKDSKKETYQYMTKMENEWDKRQSFLKNVQSMLLS